VSGTRVDPSLHRPTPATTVLVIVCVVAFVAQLALALRLSTAPRATLLRSIWILDDLRIYDRLGGLVAARAWVDGEFWRAMMTVFLHGSWLHLAVNALALWSVGRWLERAIGSLRTLVVFLVGGLTGSLLSLSFSEAAVVVGASGGVFALAAALVAVRWSARGATAEAVEPVEAGSLARQLLFWIALGAALPLLGAGSLISQAGHVGGLLAGVALGLGFAAPDALGRWIGQGTAAALLLGGAIGASRPVAQDAQLFLIAGHHLAQDDHAAALPVLERLLKLESGDPDVQNALAYCLALAGEDLPRAERLVRAALEQRPSLPSYIDTLGWVECRQGRASEGQATLLRAISLGGWNAEIVGHVAACPAAAAPHAEAMRDGSGEIGAAEQGAKDPAPAHGSESRPADAPAPHRDGMKVDDDAEAAEPHSADLGSREPGPP
jgi:membrane associated rhomboid family serine protease